MRLWYKNENQISWLEVEPYVACRDPFTVIDAETGEGLSNFRTEQWTSGRKVVVTTMLAAPLLRTEQGLGIYNPKHFGSNIAYKPVETVMTQ